MALSLEEVAKRISKNLLSTVVALGGYNIHQAGFPLKLNGFHVPDVIGKKGGILYPAESNLQLYLRVQERSPKKARDFTDLSSG